MSDAELIASIFQTGGGWAVAGGLAVLMLVGVLRGWMIPGPQHRRELDQAHRETDSGVKRGDEWRETALAKDAVIDRVTKQNTDLIQANKISDHFYSTYLEHPVPEDTLSHEEVQRATETTTEPGNPGPAGA